MAAQDESAVEREAFLAALRTLEPVPPGEDGSAGELSTAAEDDEQTHRESVMAEIADGVRAEAERDEPGPAKGNGRGNGESGTVTTLGAGILDGIAGSGHGPDLGRLTFEELVREVLSEELRRWCEDNLEQVTERVVREELRLMGRRPAADT